MISADNIVIKKEAAFVPSWNKHKHHVLSGKAPDLTHARFLGLFSVAELKDSCL